MLFLPFYNSVPQKGRINNFNGVQLNGSYILLATNLCNFASGKFLLNEVSWEEFVYWWLMVWQHMFEMKVPWAFFAESKPLL